MITFHPKAASLTPSRRRLADARFHVRGRPAHVMGGGDGPVIVFLHGWGMGSHPYRPALAALVARGYTVVAPSLPAFGGSAVLHPGDCTIAGYAQWVDELLDELGVDQDVILVGHSFGGGVAIEWAHAAHGRVAGIVLVNSVGGAWRVLRGSLRPMAERPLWDWGLGAPSDALPVAGGLTRVVPALVAKALPSVVTNPIEGWMVAHAARSADLTHRVSALRGAGVPIAVIRGRYDGIVPESSFTDLCAAAGVSGRVVFGTHSWPIAQPRDFGRVVAAEIRSWLG